MKIIYIVDFSIEGNSGKNKATREKSLALEKIVGSENFVFIYPKSKEGFFVKSLFRILLDFKVFFKTFFLSPEYVVIQRVVFLPLSRLLFYLKRQIVVSEFHADMRDEIPHLNKSSIIKKLLYVISCFFDLNYKWSSGIIYNHPYLQQKFSAIYKVSSIYSYNGSNCKDFYPIETNIAREKLEIHLEYQVYLFLGSVSQWHGVDYLIDVFNEKIIQQEKNIFLYVVGVKDNDYASSLRAKIINDNIKFIPAVDNELAKYYINAATYCLLPVKQIRISPGSPLKLYDYIACGKPIISQKEVAGYSDEIEQHQLGFTTDFTNAPQSALDIINISKLDVQKFYKNNLDVAINKTNWQSRMNNWVTFIQSLKKPC